MRDIISLLKQERDLGLTIGITMLVVLLAAALLGLISPTYTLAVLTVAALIWIPSFIALYVHCRRYNY